MNMFTEAPDLFNAKSKLKERASARLASLSLVALLAGLAIGGLVVYQSLKPRRPVVEPGSIVLSEGTKTVLTRLRSPVVIHFYSLFNQASVSPAIHEAAIRAAQLLSEFERQAAGKITLTQFTEWSDANAKSAAADGLVPFNIEKGDPIYVGLHLAQGKRTHIIAQIVPEWAPALEFDLARALDNLSGAESTPPPAADVARVVTAEQMVKKTIANPNAVSLADGKRILQELAGKEFQAAVQEMNQAIAAAEQRVVKAETDGSESEKQSALAQLQEVRAKFGEQLREIGLRSQTQLEAWERLKTP